MGYVAKYLNRIELKKAPNKSELDSIGFFKYLRDLW